MTDSKSPSDQVPGEQRKLGLVRVAGLLSGLAAAVLLIAVGGPLPGRSLIDSFQRIAPRPIDRSVAQVVLIDPKSLREVGPWPWPRYLVARLTEAIASRGAAAIGFDVIFPETDRYNPDHVAGFFPELSPAARAEMNGLPSMDAALADVVSRQQVVLPRVGVAEGSDDFPFALGVDRATLPVSATFTVDPGPGLLSFPRAITNIPDLDEVAAGEGLINGPPDSDGIVRRVPLVARVAGIPTPGLALELARVGQGLEKIEPVMRGGDLVAVRLGQRTLPVDAEGRMRLRFGRFNDAHITSALSLLQRGIPADAFRGKIVIIGMGTAASYDVVSTPLEPQTYGVFVQAQAVNAIVGGTPLVRPAWAPAVEWGTAAALVLFAMFQLPRLHLFGSIALTIAIVGELILASLAAFAWADWLIDPLPPLAVGGAAGFGVFMALFGESSRLQRRLRDTLDRERVASARAAGELEAARDIQLGMLPRRESLYRLHPAVDVDAVLEPARSVGGDFFDAMMIDPHRLCFLVGDVTGKGVPAALFMALSKALSKSVLLREGRDLGAAVRALNAEIARDNAGEMFVTMLVGVIEPASGRVTLCNAGHENPLRIDLEGRVVPIALDGGPPLCVVDDFPYPAETIDLAPGEAIVLISDGVTEAQAPDGAFFDADRLAAALSAGGAQPSEAVNSVRSAVRAFEDGSEPSDDMTVLAIRYCGPQSA